MDVEIIISDNKNKDFISLTQLLDYDLYDRYGTMQKKYDKLNQTDDIIDAVILYQNKVPVACGAYKRFDNDTIELKRVFVNNKYRRQGLAKIILRELEKLGLNLGFKYAVLETGIKQPEAINLYQCSGYEMIQNFGPYLGDGNSVCMKKIL